MKKIKLILRTEVQASRGAARERAQSMEDQASINDAAAGLFSISSISTQTVGAARAAGEELSADYPADQIVQVELADGGQLWLTLERLQELAGQTGDALALTADTSLGRGGSPSRGITDWIRKISIVDILWGDELKDAAATAAVRKAIAKIESGLLDDRTGVYHCRFDAVAPTFEEVSAPIEHSEKPVLVLLHGTASSTLGSFSGLWSASHRNTWLDTVANLYGRRVYALEHCTLSESPIHNACVLLERLPRGQRLHLISHSRGGLVGELLCRGSVGGRVDPVTDDDVVRYISAYPGKDADSVEAKKQIRTELEQLNRLLAEKRPRVERFVRVACPSRGTTLAAKRLDVYLNLLLSGLQMAGTQVLGPLAGKFIGSLKSLVIAVAHKRFDDELLPGIKAMVPDGGLARFINDPRITVDADLSVVGGNSEMGGGLRQTLLVALSNLYYWQANDWVVETDAMTGGHPRLTPGCFFLDDGSRQGEAVNHFSYFKNHRTFNAVLQVLAGRHRELPDFVSLAAEPIKTKSRGKIAASVRCITVMLPGLPGSHLSEEGDRIWLHPLRIAVGGLDRIDPRVPENAVTPDGWFYSRYEDMAEYLEERGHRVVVFDYDWRLSLPANSRRLAERMGTLAREATRESLSIRILAHSMGGWVSLHWLANDNRGLWDTLCRQHDARLIIAGTPLKGTLDSVQLLTAHHPLLSMLAAVDFEHDTFDLIDQLRHYPGLLETVPGEAVAGAGWDFFDAEPWERLKPVLPSRWRRPNADALRKAYGVRSQVDVDAPPLHGNRVLYLAGQDDATPCSIEISGDALAFRYTAEGDGLTTWESVPSWLREHQCWYLPRVKHGDLLRSDGAFPAIQELLETGDTRLLSQRAPTTARGVTAVPDIGPDTPILFPTTDDIEAAALHGSSIRFNSRAPVLPKCHVRIRHGNLSYADVPVMVGHYEGDGIEGSEAALDAMLSGRLRALHRANLYPGPLGTVEILTQPGTRRTAGAVVVGLGPVGRISADRLQQTLRNAIIRFGLEQAEKLRQYEPSNGVSNTSLTLASLVVGSGIAGLTLADAVKALLEAVVGANRQLHELDAPQLQRLDILELFEDQAIAIAHACARVGRQMDLALTFDLSIATMEGGLVRPFFDEQTPWWRRIQITSEGNGRLEFIPLTDKAAIDVQEHSSQTALIDEMLEDATATTSDNPAIAQSLFELLIPNPLKAQVEAQGGMVMLVDDGAAKYPWELLSNRRSRDPRPLATRIGLVRQLYNRSGKPQFPTVHNWKALVVGDTQSGREFPELPGAVAEAEVVCEQLNRKGFDAAQPLIRCRGVDIVMTMTNCDYQIVHLAGHGVIDHPMNNRFNGREERKTGMVLGEGIVLGPEEINALGRMPELVFLNCCHLGANKEPIIGGPRHKLAANLGTAFIRAGAKCVVAAGWAVDDAAAALFAETFYEGMLSGSTFGEAVTAARLAVFDKHRGTNTWGAYQCYGDYAFTLKGKESGPSPGKRAYFSAREVEIDAANIRSQAHTIDLKAGDAGAVDLLDRLANIEEQLAAKAHLKTGAACTAIGAAYHELGAFKESARWSEQAQTCEDGGVTIKALENRANALTRLAEQEATRLLVDELPDAALKRMRSANKTAEDAIALTSTLLGFGDTVERVVIRASAYKHHGFINTVIAATGTSQREKRQAHREARESLFAAYELYRARADEAPADTGWLASYPLLNASALWLHLSRQSGLTKKIRERLPSASAFSDELKQLSRQFDAVPPAEGKQRFWDRTDRINLALCRALVDGKLHQPATRPLWKQLAGEYKEEFALASRRESDSVVKQIRILSNLLGSGEPSLNALARLYKEISTTKPGD